MNFAINGFGRIGRAVFRLSLQRRNCSCIIINEPKASISDMCYFLKYDSLYGKMDVSIYEDGEGGFIIEKENFKQRVKVYHTYDFDEFLKKIPEDCMVIEASGIENHIDVCKKMKEKHRVIFTMSSTKIENEIILGVNDEHLPCCGTLISGSICDTIAIAPVLKCIYSLVDSEYTLITTMHPALSYQHVIDNYIDSNQNRSLGRQYIDSIIPKRTSAESVLKKFFIKESSSIRCLSYRIPTESVCGAEITVIAKNEASLSEIIKKLKESEYIQFSNDDLVSIDYKASKSSAVVDMRWTEVLNGKIIKIVIWYDNEYGYSSRLLDLMEKICDEKNL